MHFIKRLYFLCAAIVLAVSSVAQPQLQQIPHCPSNEIYDMITDKKGFIWIAHNLGISRYDGISFTSFNNPEQTAISMTDLIEDNYGRIWCHNFNGQIFYIQNEKMFCLKEYDFTKESIFPRIVLCGEELVITSKKGLFVCNTTTLECRYLRTIVPGLPNYMGTTSESVIGNKVLLYGGGEWFVYSKTNGVERLLSFDTSLNMSSIITMALQPHACNNMAFLVDNSSRAVYALKLLNKKLSVIWKRPMKAAINSISVLGDKFWINTQMESFSSDNQNHIDNYNLTSVITDHEGNKWYGSLTSGLLTSFKRRGWQIDNIKYLKPNEYVRYIKRNESAFLLSSQYGRLVFAKNINPEGIGGITYTLAGIPENIQSIKDENKFLIQTSNNLYLANGANHTILRIDSSVTVKDITLNGNTAFLAMPTGLLIKDLSSWGIYGRSAAPTKRFIINDSLITSAKYLKKPQRTRAVVFDTGTNSLLIAFTDGLQRLQNNKLTYVFYKNTHLYVSSMAVFGSKIYAATFNNGLFMIGANGAKKIETDAESPLDAIVKIKLCNNHLWLFRVHDIQVLDVKNDKFLDVYPFPEYANDITDVEEDSTNIYLATIHGLYTIAQLQKQETTKANPLLLYMQVNNADTVYSNDVTLVSEKNNLFFKLAIPVYQNAEQVHFKYRLNAGTGIPVEDAAWYYTRDAQRDIQFNSLKPGSYTLEIIAVKDNEVISNKPLIYSFTILQPWYNTWWFYTSIIIFSALAFFALYRYRLRQALKIELVRRKISTDLHDDIGSTLSSINVYSQLAKGDRNDNEYINTIQANAVEIINNLDDLVWNINPKNDVLSQLLNRMQLFAMPLLQEKNIECIFKIKTTDKEHLVTPDTRANIFLLFKEAINNVVKHSDCTICQIFFIQKGTSLRLAVKDNGKGFNPNNINRHRNGLYNMQQRAKDLKGEIIINSRSGNGTEIKISCRF